MKVLVYLTLIVSTIWGMIAFPDYSVFSSLKLNLFDSMWNMIVGVYKYMLPSVFWGMAVIYSYDVIMAMCNKSTPYMRELYESTKVELFILLALFVFNVILYTQAQVQFTNLTVDISMAGFGFLVFGNIGMLRLFRFKIGRQKYPWKVALIFSLISLLSSLYFLSVTFDIASGRLNLIQSLWSQITVLCFSISLYFFAKHVNFIMEKGRVEASPVLRDLFSRLSTKHKMYEQAAMAAELWNKEAEKERAIVSSITRKNRKRKKKKK